MRTSTCRFLAAASVMALVIGAALPQGPGRRPPPGGGGGGGSTGGGGGTPPPRVEPAPTRVPPRNDPPRNDPPRNDPPRIDPPRNDPGPSSLPQGTRGGGVEQAGARGAAGLGNQDRRGTRPDYQSRSGQVRYGTINNVYQQGRSNPITFGAAPIVIDRGVLGRRVNDSERIGLVRNGVRVGYYHWNNRWRDDWFAYPFYVFDPFAFNNRVYCSPWYGYAALPPYINSSRVIVVQNVGFGPWVGNPYPWNGFSGGRGSQWDDGWNDRNRRPRGDRDLDEAIADLQDSFERQDRRAAGRLVPRDGNVHIYNDDRYSYSLSANDFYDLFLDGMFSSRSERYVIVRVETGNRTARVYARHEVQDPWGRRQAVFHRFTLEVDRRGYVIREFGTSTRG